jgi:Fic-DOC domain mobile mystery protein B
MSDPLFEGDDEANTPLTAEEQEQLLPTYITTRAELNEAEQVNITDASRWLVRTRNPDLLDDAFLRELHRRMFGDVWKWAGSYRQSERNIGIEAYRIPVAVRELLDDVRYWIEHETFAPDELAIRFSHRFVAIHPFPNGNGRFSRLIGDRMAQQLGRPRFSWGRISLTEASKTRKIYIAALRTADDGDIAPLLAFARD